MNITADTKLSAIMKEYPWLLDEAVKIDSKFQILNNPVGKMFINNSTVKELSAQAGLDPDFLISQIKEMIANHNS